MPLDQIRCVLVAAYRFVSLSFLDDQRACQKTIESGGRELQSPMLAVSECVLTSAFRYVKTRPLILTSARKGHVR